MGKLGARVAEIDRTLADPKLYEREPARVNAESCLKPVKKDESNAS